jgi:glutathione peroxidase-family protein
MYTEWSWYYSAMPRIATPSQELIDILKSEHHMGPTADGKSIHDLHLSSVDGSGSNMLADRHGKVTMVVNVTGECGNSMQYPMLQVLEYDYADYDFKILCVPTNDYCEYGYGDFKDNSTSTAEQAHDYAYYNYRVRMDFSELVVSRCEHEDEEPKTPHPLYVRLGVGTKDDSHPIRGNFEKWVVSKDGTNRARFTNGSLLPANLESGYDDYSPQEALRRIRAAIEYYLSE